MQQHNARHYFPGFARIAVPIFGIPFGVLWTLQFSVFPGVIMALLYSIAMAWFLSWFASRRKPLSSFQAVSGLRAWKYVDLSGQCDEVSLMCTEVLRSMCNTGSVGEYGIPGALVGETKSNLLTWGSELLVLIECLDPTVTRVQVLSRPLVPANFIDFGSNKRLASAFVEKLRPRYTILTEGS